MEIPSELRDRLNIVERTWLIERKSWKMMLREIWNLEGLKFKSTKLKKKKQDRLKRSSIEKHRQQRQILTIIN